MQKPNGLLRGLMAVMRQLVAAVQSRAMQAVATLDQDATLVETGKDEALYCYKKFKAYQPLNTYWAEQGLVLHTEFRDGNVPAGYEQLRVLREALECLPAGVEKVYLRSDTAGYQVNLLKYCAEGGSERFGVIEFAVGVDVGDCGGPQSLDQKRAWLRWNLPRERNRRRSGFLRRRPKGASGRGVWGETENL